MAKQIHAILKLKDQFTKPLKLAEKGTVTYTRQVEKARKVVERHAMTLNNKLVNGAKNAAKALVAVGAAATGIGFKEAMDMEGYKAQLETATKSTKKASEIMQYAINLANKTPFEGVQMVEGAAKFEAMGMSAKKWLTYAGDMAGATNKDFDQAVEALIDAQTGELERLKEFGITKRMIQDKADKMFANQQVVNNQGQIVNQEKFNEAMLALMNEKFAGGMKKQANTLKGAWSTVTGVTKSALANIMGMSNDGSIRAGSAFDILKTKAMQLSKKLTQWQNDGTLDALTTKIGNALSTALNIAGKAISFLKNNIDWILPVLKAAVVAFTAFNVINKVKGMFQTFSTGVRILKVAFSGLNLTALKWIVIIGAIVVAGTLLYKAIKWIIDKLSAFCKKVGQAIDKCSFLKGAIDGVKKAFNFVTDAVKGAIDKIKTFLGLDTKKTVEVDVVQTGAVGSSFWDINPTKPKKKNALGTPYFSGGWTQYSENGRSEAALLPSGTQIIPHDKVDQAIGGGKNINVQVIVQGNVIGNKQYMEETGSYVARKILDALGNA